MLLHCVLIISRPQIRPEPNRFWGRCTASNDDSQRFGLGCEWNSAHGFSSSRSGIQLSEHLKSTVHAAAGCDRTTIIPRNYEGADKWGVSVGRSQAKLRACPGDTMVCRGPSPPAVYFRVSVSGVWYLLRDSILDRVTEVRLARSPCRLAEERGFLPADFAPVDPAPTQCDPGH